MSIESEFTARAIAYNGSAVPVPIRLAYDPDQPLEVVLTFLDREDVPWTFARDLLNRALTERAGLGDVQAWTNGQSLTLVLHGFDESNERWSAEFVLPARKVAQFLARTAQLVPYGQERVDVDGGLALLLGGAA